MRSVIAAVVLMCAVVCGGAWYTSKLIDVSGELSEMNAAIQSSLEDNAIHNAQKDIERMKEYLDKKEQVLSAMGDHEEIDKIRMSMAELERYAEGGNTTDAIAKSEVLEFLFEHMPENYRLKIENIL